jgi:hypothetical protein
LFLASNVSFAYAQGADIIVEGSDFEIFMETGGGLAFQHRIENYTFTIEVLSGTWNGTNCTLGMTDRGGNLYFYSNADSEVQLSHNNDVGLRLDYEGIVLSILTPSHSWNGTIPADTPVYLKWSFSFLMPHEENFMLYVGLLGIALLVSGLLFGAYSFTQYPIFSFKRETIWETSLLVYSFTAAFIGAGLIITWLLS